MAPTRRQALSIALGLLAAAVALQPLLSIASGSPAPSWSHWWCSPGALRSAAHTVHSSGLGATILTALEIHWPHLIPALLGLATLVYLRRANVRYHAQRSPSVMAHQPAAQLDENPFHDGAPPIHAR